MPIIERFLIHAVIIALSAMPAAGLAQPSKSYKKSMKTLEKNDKSEAKGKMGKLEAKTARKIKHYKDLMADLDKQLKDAEASSDEDKQIKIKYKLGGIKTKKGILQGKFEKKVAKIYRKNQTKEVRKRMKKHGKKSKQINENKREFFLTRWFRKK